RSSPSPFFNSSRCLRKTGHRAHQSFSASRHVQRECVSLHVAPRVTQSSDVTEFRQYDPRARSSARVCLRVARMRVCVHPGRRVCNSPPLCSDEGFSYARCVVTREYPNYWRGLMLIVVVDVAVMVVTRADGDHRRLGCAEGSYLSPPTVSFGVFAHTPAAPAAPLPWGRRDVLPFHHRPGVVTLERVYARVARGTRLNPFTCSDGSQPRKFNYGNFPFFLLQSRACSVHRFQTRFTTVITYKRRFLLQGHAFLCRGNPRCGGGGVGSKVARGATAAVTKPVRTPPYRTARSSSFSSTPRRRCKIAKFSRDCYASGWVGGRAGGRVVDRLFFWLLLLLLLYVLLFCQRPMTREKRERGESTTP
ncbi:Uncharacterized protein FWK35_00017200, partial [Aphis craccivora]